MGVAGRKKILSKSLGLGQSSCSHTSVSSEIIFLVHEKIYSNPKLLGFLNHEKQHFKYTGVSFHTDHSRNPEVLIQLKLNENLV